MTEHTGLPRLTLSIRDPLTSSCDQYKLIWHHRFFCLQYLWVVHTFFSSLRWLLKENQHGAVQGFHWAMTDVGRKMFRRIQNYWLHTINCTTQLATNLQFPSERRSSSTVMGLWDYTFRIRKTTCNPHCIFGTSNYKLWWICCHLQLLGDLTTDDDLSWATDVHVTTKQRDRCKGKERNNWEMRPIPWIQMDILMWLLL